MDFRHLETFLAVVEQRTFAAAAEEINTVQSTVSANIKALEREMRAALFDRSARTAVLTPAGRALVPRAKALVDQLALTRKELSDIGDSIGGRLRVGTIGSTEPIELPKVLKQFGDANPHVILEVLSDSVGTAGLVERLRRSEIDIAFIANRLPDRPGPVHDWLVRTLLAEGDLVFIASPGHPLVERTDLQLADLASQIWIESPSGQTNRTITDEAFRAAGLSRTVNLEVAEPAKVPNYVAADIGIAAVPDFIAHDRTDVRVLRVEGVKLKWSIAIARHSERSSTLIEAFWNQFEERARNRQHGLEQ
ncbi:LysR family transcriptional regulator [Rhodococcoides trifolii]|uniref:LysR family transcriptional regulator n=1 Tax=Rhodococcoides trifolii TaxID=908250 RepID=A0A917G7W7_9NOCA|nr:LysR family transcriptional regulator [Rhodococcus trifolii]GGG27098.1 LysR family transcriptional regulator [Rhodococcus trifolii]